MNALVQGDCLEEMKRIPDGAVDMVFADLPYGVTANKWDVVIPFEPLWEHLLRIGKKNCAFVFTATQPFATSLICSQRKLFRYEIIWVKSRATNFGNVKRMPMRSHENIIVFYKQLPTYNPQMSKTAQPRGGAGKGRASNTNYGTRKHGLFGGDRVPWVENGLRYPRSVLQLGSDQGKVAKHPTQKPVALLEWLIKTYSNEGDLVLDPTMGSGTTGVACANTKRHFIGIEKDPTYFSTATQRIATAEADAQG